MFVFRFLCQYKTVLAFDIIKIIDEMNERADKILGDMDDKTRYSSINNTNHDSDYKPYDLYLNSLESDVHEHNLYIKRIIDNRFDSKINDYLNQNLNHRNIQQNFLCFSQNYNNKNVYWYIMEKNNLLCEELCYFRKKDVRKLCRDVCQGIVYLHEKNIIHNNINRISIFGVQRLSKDANLKLQSLIQDIISQLNGHNCRDFSNSFTILTNNYLNINKPNLEENFNPTRIEQSPEKLYDLKVSVHPNCYNPMLPAYIYICITSDSKWLFQKFKADDLHVTSIAAHEQEISKIFKFFVNEKPCKIKSNDDYKNGIVYSLEDIWLYKRCIYNLFNYPAINVHTTFTEQTLTKALLESEYDFKIANIEDCYGFQNEFVIDSYYKDINLGYTPPEYLQNAKISFKSDIWRLGILALELISPRFLKFIDCPDVTDTFILNKLYNGFFDEINSDIGDDAAVDFIKKCLNFDPDLRPTASELAKHPYINEERM
ncbi:hypothetical protein COBT_001863 [Conglomerata obtusa]